MTHNIVLSKIFVVHLKIVLEISWEVTDVDVTFAQKNFSLEIVINKR